MGSFRIMSVQWIDVEDVATIDDAARAASDLYYGLDDIEREALPAFVVAVDLDDIESARLDLLAAVDRVIGGDDRP